MPTDPKDPIMELPPELDELFRTLAARRTALEDTTKAAMNAIFELTDSLNAEFRDAWAKVEATLPEGSEHLLRDYPGLVIRDGKVYIAYDRHRRRE